MFLLFLTHPIWLAAAAAIQFDAVRRAREGSVGWEAAYRVVAVAALILGVIGLWFALGARPVPRVAPNVVPAIAFGRDVALWCFLLVLAGVAGWFEWSVIRWFRLLSHSLLVHDGRGGDRDGRDPVDAPRRESALEADAHVRMYPCLKREQPVLSKPPGSIGVFHRAPGTA